MGIKITAIEYFLPSKVVTNSDLKREFPNWDIDTIEKKTGVLQRHIAKKNETALDLAFNACKRLLNNNQNELDKIDALIFCTQSPDYIMPSNSYLLQKKLGLSKNIFAFDFNLACSGYTYGLAMANSFISSKLVSKVLLVNSDTYSKYISQKDRATRVLFGDGAAATIIEETSDNSIIDMDFSADGYSSDCFRIPAGGSRIPYSIHTSKEFMDKHGNVKSQNNIHMDGLAVWAGINTNVPAQINSILIKNKLDIKNIDMFFFHQASQFTLDSLMKKIPIDKEKVFINLSTKGNTVSASIPIALKDAIMNHCLNRGDLILLSGFGVGMSYGTILLNY